MKKILFIHHATVSVGAGLSALHIISNIPKEEYSVVVCMPQEEGDLHDKLEKMDVRVRKDLNMSCSYSHVNGYHYPFFSIPHFHNVYEIIQCKLIIKNVLSEEKPDIVLVNSMTLFWVGKIAQEMNMKTVCFHRETYCHGLLGIRTRYIKYNLNKYFDKIVFLSKYDMKATGRDEKKYVQITDKVDCEKYNHLDKLACRKELNLPQDDKLILFLGGVSELKGIRIALKSMDQIRSESKMIILQYEKTVTQFIGFSGLRQKLRRLQGRDIVYWADKYIESHRMGNKLILRGRTDEVEKYFVACDVVLFPSQEAHQARPIYEAGIAKRPIIISDFENTREFLDETNGWCVCRNQVTAWAETIDKLLSEPAYSLMRVEENYEKSVKNNNLCDLMSEIGSLLENL